MQGDVLFKIATRMNSEILGEFEKMKDHGVLSVLRKSGEAFQFKSKEMSSCCSLDDCVDKRV